MVNIILIGGWKVPNISWQKLIPKKIKFDYQCARPNKNPLLVTKLKKIGTPYLLPELFNDNLSFIDILKVMKKFLKDISPPYQFICHSFGYLVTYLYCCLYPKNIHSIIVLDGTSHIPFKYFKELWQQVPDTENIIKTYNYLPKLNKFPKSIPVIALVNTGYENNKIGEKIKIKYFKQLVKLNKQSKIFLLEKRDHNLHHTEPELIVNIAKNLIDKN
jgi:hypothetical protein